jgi:UDP-2-acetamido-3-amino-2,3-dideoxy-glucuronate N-acetyltransferase
VNKVHVHPTAVVDKTAIIGYDTKVWRFVHARENAEIGRGCVLGDFVYVGREVKIGNGVKLENRATVYREVKIERKVFRFSCHRYEPPISLSFNTDWKIVETLVEEGASIGAGAVIGVRCYYRGCTRA